jgi:hypothetical protein
MQVMQRYIAGPTSISTILEEEGINVVCFSLSDQNGRDDGNTKELEGKVHNNTGLIHA